MKAIEVFRQKLNEDRACIGAGITLSDPLVVDALGDSVDFFWIDTEHTPMNPETLALHLLAARAHGVPGLVRVAAGVTHLIKPALDAGAHGIIVPQVRSAEEVRQAVADCRYPPAGRRGFGPRVPACYGRLNGKTSADWSDANIFVAVQIETREALDDLEAIVTVGGVDSLVLGPADLSFALGVPGQLEHPTVVAAVERVVMAARGAGLFVGTGMGCDAAYAATMAKRGVQWIQVGSDFEYLIGAFERARSALRP